MLFNPTLKEVRQFFHHAWEKSLQSQKNNVLSPIEQIALYWMQRHPEYHNLLNGPIQALENAQFLPEAGQTNPFLHLSMHLSISEQLSIDQPPGIRAAHQKLSQKLDDEHAAAHTIMECLGQILWQAQRDQTEPDSQRYIELIEQAAS